MCWFVALGATLTGSTAAAAGTALAASQAAVGAMATLSAASTAASFVGQRKQASAQRKYQRAASLAETARLKQEQAAMRIRQDQEMQAKNAELFAIQQRARSSIARATVAAGEAGVSGSSVDVLLNDYYRQMGNYQYALTREQGFQNVATGLALQDAASRSTQAQIGINRPVNEPSFIEGVTSIAASTMQGANMGINYSRARGLPVS